MAKVEFGGMSLIGIAANYLQKKEPYLIIIFFGTLISCTGVFIHYAENVGFSQKLLLGSVSGLIGACFAYVYSKQSVRLNKNTSLSATQILAIRFWLVLPFALALTPSNMSVYLTSHNLLIFIATAFISIILPTFVLLKAIFQIGPEKMAISSGFIPPLTYLFSLFLTQEKYNTEILLFSLLTSFFITLPYLMKLSIKKA